MPEHFGSWKGAYNRLRKWAADGTWERVFTALPSVPISTPPGAGQKGLRPTSRGITPSDGLMAG